MKLSKFNAILIIFSVGFITALDSPTKIAIEQKATNSTNKKAPGKVKVPQGTSSRAKNIVGRKLNLLIIPNPKLKENPKLITYQKCLQKSGYLTLVKNQNNLSGELRVTKIFVNMDLNSINLFMTTQMNSLFNTIKLGEILRISQQKLMQYYHCFDIVLNEARGMYLHKGSVSLCANSQNEMKDWITSILEFKECQINPLNTVRQDKLVVDFSKVNEVTKDNLLPISASPSAKKINSLAYENQPHMESNSYKTQQVYEISKRIKIIMQRIKESNIREQQLHRRLSDKLLKTRKLTNDAIQKEILIKKILEQRQEQEEKRKNDLIQMEHKNKEIQTLKLMEKQIKQLKKKEFTEISQSYNEAIKKEKQKANNRVKNMLDMIRDQNKYKPYDKCIDAKLKGYADSDYVKGLCHAYYGESKERICQQKEHFCSMCCNHHVGSNHNEQLFDCIDTCKGLVKQRSKLQTRTRPK